MPPLVYAPTMLRDDGLTPDYPLDEPLAHRRWWQHPMARFAFFLVAFAALAYLLQLPILLGVLPTGPTETVWSSLTQVIAASLAFWLTIHYLERRPMFELAPRRSGGLLVGLALGTACIFSVVAVIWLLGGLHFMGTRTPTAAELSSLIFRAGLAAGVVEEILMRGMLLRLLEEYLGTWLAIVASGFIFGLAHLGNDNATIDSSIAIALQAGLLFGALYCLTRNLWVTIGLHMAWNMLQGALGAAISGNSAAGFLRTEAAGKDLISGGAFGLEGSVVTTVLLGGLAVVILVLIHRRGLAVASMWSRAAATAARADGPTPANVAEPKPVQLP